MTGMTPERLAEIRARAERVAVMEVDEDRYGDRAVLLGYTRALSASADDVPELVAEVGRLAAAFEEIRSEYNGARKDRRADYAAHVAEIQRLTNDLAVTEAQAVDRDEAATILAQQVEKVRALHQPWDDGPQPYCTHDREPWPCPTEQALGAR